MDEEQTTLDITNSILNSVKKQLGLESDYDCFDADVLMNINSAISVLTQLGIGPKNGFFITGEKETYQDFLGDLESMLSHFVKTYLYYKTRIGFDPPSNSFVLDSFVKQIAELEWRMKVLQEELENNGEDGEISK